MINKLDRRGRESKSIPRRVNQIPEVVPQHECRSPCRGCFAPPSLACQPRPVGLLQPAASGFPEDRARFREPAPSVNDRAPLSSATWYWRHRVDASDGEIGDRAARCDQNEQARRPAAPSHIQSSFSHTCRPSRRCGMLLCRRRRRCNAAKSGEMPK